MEKLTDNEIIKALQICTSEHLGCEDGCPRRYNGLTYTKCRIVFLKDALDLINRQKAEIERLQKENETLKTNNHSLSVTLSNRAKVERAEAIKEFAERLKDKSEDCTDWVHPYVLCTDIDNLVKEMVGDVK